MRNPITGHAVQAWRRRSWRVALILLLLGGTRGCGYSWKASDYDGDGDGFAFLEDCDDGDPAIHPGATESWYDSVDQDCDGASDFDADLDGFDQGDDCDDQDPAVNPNALELCGDDVDNDCDSLTDSDDPDTTSEYYVDGDEDGYGAGSLVEVQGCAPPAGYADRSDDCDDGDPLVHPDAEEDCDEVDRDCDGDPTDGATDAPSWYKDNDNDSYGDPDTEQRACTQPSDTIADGSDCDDSDADLNPAASEVCNGIDDDCDGLTDDEDDSVDQTTQSLWFVDQDHDSAGQNRPICYYVVCACAAPGPAGCFVDNPGDCDDGDDSLQDECDGYIFKDWSSAACPIAYDGGCIEEELDPDTCTPASSMGRRGRSTRRLGLP